MRRERVRRERVASVSVWARTVEQEKTGTDDTDRSSDTHTMIDTHEEPSVISHGPDVRSTSTHDSDTHPHIESVTHTHTHTHTTRLPPVARGPYLSGVL